MLITVITVMTMEQASVLVGCCCHGDGDGKGGGGRNDLVAAHPISGPSYAKQLRLTHKGAAASHALATLPVLFSLTPLS